MRKQEFLDTLSARLSGLPKQDVEERLAFYSEMIDDRVDEGATEDDAVSQIGSVDGIAVQIVSDIPLAKIAKEKIKPKRRLKAWEMVLLALGSPIWIALLVSAFTVIIALYASLWSVVVSLWAAFGALVGSAFGGVLGGAVFALSGNIITGIVILGASCVCAGVAVFMFFGCMVATKGTALLAKRIVLVIKICFIRKERVS